MALRFEVIVLELGENYIYLHSLAISIIQELVY